MPKSRKRMTMAQFIKTNRTEIDGAIKKVCAPCVVSIDDRERRMWILNDEGLYNWARKEGVRV